ncbi:MAG: hypothetical protein R3272_07910 [Candidatus Promineifilaceae bacterium]|nr:hypothetical protein [Candidatus Promineifilaceae bacterium]
MAEIYEQDRPRKQTQGQSDGQNMIEMAGQVEEHYTRPSPKATSYTPNFFPAILNQGIFWGLLIGALFGLLLAWLVHNGRVTPTGWEGLFSLVPFSFYSFFAFAGAAVGLAVGGVVTLLIAPVPEVKEEQDKAGEVVMVEEDETVVVERRGWQRTNR